MRTLTLMMLLAACSAARSTTDTDTDIDSSEDTDGDTQPPVASLFINEILASNDTAQSWEDGEGNQNFDDWLELYNDGDEPVALEGYGLTDGGEPWRFPADAVIAAKGHLLVWCSEQEDAAGYHADFKISRSGEVLTLTDRYDRLVNEVDMPEQTTDVATYRSPDGSETWQFGEGTPGEPNR